MKRTIFFLTVAAIMAYTCAYGQTCDANFTVNATSVASQCQSDGKVIISLSGNTSNLFNMQYGLSSSSGFTIQPQPSSTMTGIPPGTYTITVRAFCSLDAGFDVVKTLTNITVGGNYEVPLVAFSAGASRKSYSNCNTGLIAFDIARGSGTFTFTINSAPSGVTVPSTVTATKSGNIYTLVGNYPAGNYVIAVNDGCYTAEIPLTIGSISGYPSFTSSYTGIYPVYLSANPGCGLINWSIGTVANTNPDYYQYYTAGMYEIAMAKTGETPSNWTTWSAPTHRFDLSPYTYADFYAANSLTVYFRVKGCPDIQSRTLNAKKPAYFSSTTLTYGCNTYTYGWAPWIDYDGMWCYPLDYEIRRVSDNAVVWSALDRPYGSVTATALEYGVVYQLTTTDAQGTVLIGGPSNSASTFTFARPTAPSISYIDECNTYRVQYRFSLPCYPISVEVKNSSNAVIYTHTVNSVSAYYTVSGLTYGENYTFSATYTGSSQPATYTSTLSRSSNMPTGYTLSVYTANTCAENRARLQVRSSNTAYTWPVGTTVTITGPAGYTSQSYTYTGGTAYQNYWYFAETDFPPGVYTATINHGCGTPLTATLNLSNGVYQVSSLSYTSSGIECDGLSIYPSGGVTYYGTAETPYYRLTSGPGSYDKSVVTTGGSLLLSASGTYRLGIMRTNSAIGCVLREITIEYNPDPMRLNPVVTSSYVCDGESVGHIMISAENGKPPYTYQLWNSTNTAKVGVPDITTSGVAHFNYGTSGSNYWVHVIDECSSFAQSVTLADLSTASIVHSPEFGQVCQGDPIYLQCITLGTTQYSWTGPNGWSANNVQNPVINNAQLNMSGWYKVTVQPEFCGAEMIDSVYITVNPRPVSPTVPNRTINYCQNASSTSLLSATGATASASCTLRWYGSDGVTTITPPSLISTGTIGTTTYYVSQYYTATGCEGPLVSVEVIVSSLPSIPTVNAVSSLCPGESFTITVSPVTTGYYYKVYATSSGTLSLGSSAVSSGNITGLTAPSVTSVYYVSAVNNITGCESSSRRSVSIPIKNTATSSDITANGASICNGSSATLTASSGISSPVYKWYSSQTATTYLASSSTYATPALTTSSTYYVSVSGTSYCENAVNNRKPVAVTVYAVMNGGTINATTTTVCNNSTPGTLTSVAAASGGNGTITYQWQSSTDNVTFSAAAGANTGVSYTLPAGLTQTTYYRRQATNSCGSVYSNTITLTVYASPVVSVSASASTACQGSSVTFTANVSSGATSAMTYTWNIAGSANTTTSSTYSRTLTATSTYSVSVRNSNGCTSDNTPVQTITVIPSVTPSISISASDNNVCSDTDITYTATPTNGGASPVYQWKKNNVIIGGAIDATYTYAPADGDVITCVLTPDPGLCANPATATSNSLTMSVAPAVTPTLTISATPN